MKTYTTGQFAKAIGKDVSTIQRWDYRDILKPAAYTPGSHQRIYTQEQVDKYLGKSQDTTANKDVYIYARVSSAGQKADLERQLDYIRSYTAGRGYQVKDEMTDVGSGLNYKRKSWNKLIRLVLAKQVGTIVIAYPDRFVRFGFDWFKQLFSEYGCTIEVINNPSMSPNEELVYDLIAIIQVFSSRLSGLRKYKRELNDDESLKK